MPLLTDEGEIAARVADLHDWLTETDWPDTMPAFGGSDWVTLTYSLIHDAISAQTFGPGSPPMLWLTTDPEGNLDGFVAGLDIHHGHRTVRLASLTLDFDDLADREAEAGEPSALAALLGFEQQLRILWDNYEAVTLAKYLPPRAPSFS